MRFALCCFATCCGSLLLACEPGSRASTQPAPVTAPPPVSGSQSPSGPAATGWTKDADTVVVGAQAGVGDFFRKIKYLRPSATLSVEDSDPFAGGREQHPARVIRRSRALGVEERRRVEEILGRVQPDAAALARRCAPGGCLWIERDDGERLEDGALVRPALTELSRFFPELREY